MSEIRVRFAPSPTGFFHVGSARTALFNWLYARHHNGTFVLRIEDTDQARNDEAYVDLIYSSLRWLGLDWDEGPQVGGSRGPYRQSERSDVYASHLERLKHAGRAYEKDGAWWLRLEGERATVYDDYLKAEVEKVDAPPVAFDDLIRGHVERREERDFVLVRADGSPTFHFTNVVDDLTMGITHVIRGEDHLSNTSKHVLIYQALNAPVPIFAHLPLILKDPKVGKGKMSKRDKGALVSEYQERSFLPVGLFNYLSLLGWSPKDDREVMTIGEIIEAFDLPDVQKSPARYDEKKLAHVNFGHLKALPVETYAWHARPLLTEAGVMDAHIDEDYLQQVLAICQEKVDALENLVAFAGYFFTDDFPVDEKAAAKLAKKGDPVARVREAQTVLAQVKTWDEAHLEKTFLDLATAHGQEKPFAWWPAVRMTVSGVSGGPDFLPMLTVMGSDLVLRRLQRFTEK